MTADPMNADPTEPQTMPHIDAYRRAPLATPEPAGPAHWIGSHRDLADACTRWGHADVLALDTEFVRERTFFPGLGLIQLSVGDPMAPEIALIDGVAVTDLEPLIRLLADPGVLKIFHSPGEDFGVFQHVADMTPGPVFDTQIGAALAGFGYALGYSTLVETVFGDHLPKESQRTNWLRRPLSDEQLVYAARDVLYLPALHRHLHLLLDAKQRVPWVLEDSARLADSVNLALEPAEAWRKVKGGGRLDAAGRGALEALAAWREAEAQRRDLPRGFVLRDDAVIALATHRPRSPRALEQSGVLADGGRRRDGSAILRVLANAPQRGTPMPKRPSYDPRPIVTALKKHVAERAEAFEIPAESLASRKLLERVVRRVEQVDRAQHDSDNRTRDPLPEPLRGWRRAVVGDDLLARARDLLRHV